MRLGQYLTEENEFTHILDLIKKDCQPFLKQFKGNLLYRGSRKSNIGIIKTFPRKHRAPMSIHPKVQIILDNLFDKKFGWKPRSTGVFVIGSKAESQNYGHPYSFWPIGKFKYLWSMDVPDLFEEIWDISKDWVRWFTSGHDQLAKFVDTYTDKNLVRGIQQYNEMMFSCKSYYMVLDGYDGEILENL